MSKIISLKNIIFSIEEKTILNGVSLKCTDNERICILGENGSGKSTFLKIMSGVLKAESGSIEKTGHIRFEYVPQEFEAEFRTLTVQEFIEKKVGVTLQKKVTLIAKEIGLHVDRILNRQCGTLSGGQQKILALSCAFASNPDFILLDEPENHIDIVSRIVLIRKLQEYRGGVIFISHDRLIIDALATKVAEMTQGKLYLSEGSYQDYIDARLSRIGGMQRQYDAESKRIRQLQQTVVILKQKAIRGKETSAYHAKMAELQALKDAHRENDRPEDTKTRIRLRASHSELHKGKLLCRIEGAAFRYPEAKGDMFRDVHLEMRAGEHVVLIGRNGSGKSTFMKCLTNNHQVTKGSVTWGNGVKWAYFDQHVQFNEMLRPLDVAMDALSCGETEARAALGAMRFTSEKMTQQISELSGGERMRLRFAVVFGVKPDVIILDEPTNHLDEVTWEILLSACKQSKSTILLVSHDYEFIEEFNPSLFWLINKQTVVAKHKDLEDVIKEIDESIE
jgi:ATP-binding cassette, subfamily F, member 3